MVMKKVVLLGLVAQLAWPLTAAAQEVYPPAAQAPAAAAAEPGPHEGWMGINVGVFPSGGLPTIGGAYFLDDMSALRLDLGLDFHKQPGGVDPLGQPTDGDFNWGFSIEAGYRKYLLKAGRLYPFVQPGLFLAKAAQPGDFGQAFALQVNGGIGGEFFITDNFSASALTGVGLRFANEFKEIQFATGTTGIYVNFYW
jgi:hypothetical protein